MTEQELIKGCLKKESKSQRRLFDQYSGIMMTVCRRYFPDQKEAEDILQESFIKVFTHINQYRFEGPLEGWIKRIVINTALRKLKSKKIHYSAIDESTQESQSIDSPALTNLNAEDLLKLIGNLPEGYRVVFNLYALEGYDHNEIAKLLNINPGTSRSQLSKARGLLKTQIKELQKLPKGYA
ncbi:RNA polymerase sigma factor [Flavitalea flava]